jgi:hypothetical protein
VQALGDDFIDSITGENIATLTTEEKYNECLASSTKRIEAVRTPTRFASSRARWICLCTTLPLSVWPQCSSAPSAPGRRNADSRRWPQVLTKKPDPGPPIREGKERQRTYKTKDEVRCGFQFYRSSFVRVCSCASVCFLLLA